MMTVVAIIMAGLLPILRSSGTGSEVMQRIAVPMIGGMVSSTILTLVVIPTVYGIVNTFKIPPPEKTVRAPSRTKVPSHNELMYFTGIIFFLV